LIGFHLAIHLIMFLAVVKARLHDALRQPGWIDQTAMGLADDGSLLNKAIVSRAM
jgi:hypothetical protein